MKYQKNSIAIPTNSIAIPTDTKGGKQRVENYSLHKLFHQARNELSSAQLIIDLFNNGHNQDSMDTGGTN